MQLVVDNPKPKVQEEPDLCCAFCNRKKSSQKVPYVAGPSDISICMFCIKKATLLTGDSDGTT